MVGPTHVPHESARPVKLFNARSDCSVFWDVHWSDATHCQDNRFSGFRFPVEIRNKLLYTGSSVTPLSLITFAAYSLALSRSSWLRVPLWFNPERVRYTFESKA